ncbi:MAG: DUF4190 domain-containing protein [Actinobacteria bacterium]|nr:DUF4190 domain-containing protein [Actinomycetota bacterium]
MTDQTPAPTPEPAAVPTPAAQPAAPAYAPAGPARPWNVLAIVSLAIAIVGFSWISLGAVITGHIALSQIKKTGEQGHGLALAGTIIGYVGIAVTLIWIPIVIFGIIASASYGGYNY